MNHGYLYLGEKGTTIDYPGAAAFPGGGTFTGGLNDCGDVAGVCADSKGFQHGLVRLIPEECEEEDGNRCKPTSRAIDMPGTVQTQGINFELGPGLGTAAAGINNRREVVGMFATKRLYSAGFELPDGRFTTIDDPNSGHGTGLGSRSFGINDMGFMVGSYQTGLNIVASVSHGFVSTGQNYIPVEVPGSASGGFGTQTNEINIFLEMVGVYPDPNGTFHGMFWAGA